VCKTIICNDERCIFICLGRCIYISEYNIIIHDRISMGNGPRCASPEIEFSYIDSDEESTLSYTFHQSNNDRFSMVKCVNNPHYFSYTFNSRRVHAVPHFHSFAHSLRNKLSIYSSYRFPYTNKPIVNRVNVRIYKVCKSISVAGVCTLSKADYRLAEKKRKQKKHEYVKPFTFYGLFHR